MNGSEWAEARRDLSTEMNIQLHSQVFASRFIVNQKPMSEGQENTTENRHYDQTRDVKEGKADTGGRRIDHAQAIVIFRSPLLKSNPMAAPITAPVSVKQTLLLYVYIPTEQPYRVCMVVNRY